MNLTLDYVRDKNESGFVFQDKSLISKQRSVCGYIIKQIGSNIMKRKSLSNISLPIEIFDSISALELFVHQNAFVDILNQASAQMTSIEKIKFTLIFSLAKLNMCGKQLKPFNPILGETYQCKISDVMFYLEQTSHHPPIANFYAKGKNFTMFGFEESSAETGLNYVKIIYKGKQVIRFNDSTEHSIIYPSMKLKGTMIGKRVLKFRGDLVIKDAKNNLACLVKMKGMNNNKKCYPDYFSGVITTLSNIKLTKGKYSLVNSQRNIFCQTEGEFTQKISFDNIVYFNFNKLVFPTISGVPYTLDSDSAKRQDIIYLKKGEKELAIESKLKLEEKQRHDNKIRSREKK